MFFEAQYKDKLYTKWCDWMLKQIDSKQFREKSKNWIAPSKAITIQWCADAWKDITFENLKNACKKVFMDPTNLDEAMAVYDGIEDFHRLNSMLSPNYQLARRKFSTLEIRTKI